MNSNHDKSRRGLRLTLHLMNAFGIVLVVLVVKFHIGFLVWNALPLLVSSWLLEVIPRTGGLGWSGSPPKLKGSAIGAYTGLSLVSILWHLAWVLNLGEVATESSTSAIAFIFIPIWSGILGGVGVIVGRVIGKFKTPE